MDFNLESMLSILIQQREAIRSHDIEPSVQNPYRTTAVVLQTVDSKRWLPSLDTFRTFATQLAL
jgi:hypothetical protein